MSTWNDFLTEVRKAEKELGSPAEPWYRGHTNKDWELIPSLPRQTSWEEKEKSLFFEFTRTASRLFEKRTNDWETLFDMQHHWIPTRLLDWSTVMGVAIAFILHGDYTDTEDSALFILNPLSLNRLSGRTDVINIPEDKTFDYKTIYWEKRPVQIEKPLAIKPSQQISDRIRAQQGVFTIFGTEDASFETAGLCCTNQLEGKSPLTPDGFIPLLPSLAYPVA
ncbi:FRG domain-containing protein [Deefgea piscis]|uniref:FRG domain-containing protein n=1 Tax=Deefgea piscis TaxID=2739061 RepID=UPI001C7FFF20|nr:FRG domain-containing protein [Deefgea piscis]QZA81088.1 FRG domain-containing protein [Deefgea piscis]